MSLWDDYKVDAQFAMDFPHGVNNDEWRTREGKVLKLIEGAEKEDRAMVLLKACLALLDKQKESHYVLNLLEQTVVYDGTDCVR